MARYRIDADRSRVTIDAKSSLHPIHTESTGLAGWVELDLGDGGEIEPGAEPKGQLEFAVDRLRSGNILEDRELRRRIDAKKFPTIKGELTSLRSVDGDGSGRFVATGEITFRGVTKSSSDEITVSVDAGESIRIRGSSTFDIREFGMDPPRLLMLTVSPDVRVAIDVVAEKED